MSRFRQGVRVAMSIGMILAAIAMPAQAAEQKKGAAPAKSPTAMPPPPAIRPPGAGAPTGISAPLPEGPRIRQFTGPEQIVPGETFQLSWQVDPGVTGTPVSYVSLFHGEATVASTLPASGTHEVRPVSYPVGAASLEYVLKARDTAGKVSSRNLAVRLLSPQQALRQLEVSLTAEPREFKSGMPIELKVNLRSGYWPMSRVSIRVTHGGRVVGSLSDYMIRGPISIASLRDDGFPGTSGEYVVEIEYMRQTLQKRFATYGVPYYSLIPASR